eukprot:4651099-Pyramimonas_sp.AAC.2
MVDQTDQDFKLVKEVQARGVRWTLTLCRTERLTVHDCTRLYADGPGLQAGEGGAGAGPSHCAY